ncbi:hypothetical protein [Natronomonas salsuginis]|uniref:hypothetical protein n=1 Tax=Natronomonas salsuginis TaxID=2217661 RepID=UPI0014852B1E|nr:hypothetical protein [Natronomonas salsuginis]
MATSRSDLDLERACDATRDRVGLLVVHRSVVAGNDHPYRDRFGPLVAHGQSELPGRVVV